MPELPEVETVARMLRDVMTGASVVQARVVQHEHWSSASSVAGRSVIAIRRRGKHLLLDFDSAQTLDVHLGMSGVLRLHEVGEVTALPEPHRHERMLLHLTKGGRDSLLRLVDPRGFGHAVVGSRDASGMVGLKALLAMGPEPLQDWTAEHFAAVCARRSVAIKATLLDQSVVAGIGNYLADEILFSAGIHPATPANSVSPRRLRKLHAAAQRIIANAVDAGGATISDYRHPDGSRGDAQFLLQAYGREDEPCVRCGRPMRKIVVGGRGTTYCSKCQRR